VTFGTNQTFLPARVGTARECQLSLDAEFRSRHQHILPALRAGSSSRSPTTGVCRPAIPNPDRAEILPPAVRRRLPPANFVNNTLEIAGGKESHEPGMETHYKPPAEESPSITSRPPAEVGIVTRRFPTTPRLQFPREANSYQPAITAPRGLSGWLDRYVPKRFPAPRSIEIRRRYHPRSDPTSVNYIFPKTGGTLTWNSEFRVQQSFIALCADATYVANHGVNSVAVYNLTRAWQYASGQPQPAYGCHNRFPGLLLHLQLSAG
jgi:hypothetical protein